MNERILIVDDEEPIRTLLRYNLEKAGFACAESANAADALVAMRGEPPDLALLDLMLPDMSGLDVCRIVKHDAATAEIPIIMLTARSAEGDIVEGLNLGADDYVTKPFSPKVLVTRINSVLRRKAQKGGAQGGIIRARGLAINAERHEAVLGGEKLDLTATEFELLRLLAANAGRVFSRPQIISLIRGEMCVTDRAVDVQVLGLRRKLAEASAGSGEFIETIRGVGYRFADELRGGEGL